MPLDPTALAAQLGTGLLSFPVTHFDDDLAFDRAGYEEHLAWMAGHPVAGLFAAGGTGEYFSLGHAEVAQVVRTAIAATSGRVPILAPAGGSTVDAVAQARDAEAAGADGILLFPPYLTESTDEGLVARARAVCAATGLGVVYYNRGNGTLGAPAVVRLAEECPTLIGFKDGVGSVELITRIVTRLGSRLVYIGGLPTAETFALPYLQLGVTTYSSAMFNFVPEFALRFYDSVRALDTAAVARLLDAFVLPYLDIRDRHPATAVSIVKGGLRAIGRPAGSVRPPLIDLPEGDVADLGRLIAGIEELR
ncbi:MAG: 5-dehydro-4-deoxyglucarate dehydratase [Microbacteriaceae bacterium]|nr:5-dehydro-4-deoxyglucarate dehydratase [Microbacteriaceae bacterium]